MQQQHLLHITTSLLIFFYKVKYTDVQQKQTAPLKGPPTTLWMGKVKSTDMQQDQHLQHTATNILLLVDVLREVKFTDVQQYIDLPTKSHLLLTTSYSSLKSNFADMQQEPSLVDHYLFPWQVKYTVVQHQVDLLRRFLPARFLLQKRPCTSTCPSLHIGDDTERHPSPGLLRFLGHQLSALVVTSLAANNRHACYWWSTEQGAQLPLVSPSELVSNKTVGRQTLHTLSLNHHLHELRDRQIHARQTIF